jgi:hypothetical protein
MSNQSYYIKISPESLKSDIVQETYSGYTFGVYSGLTQILSGGTGGQSLLTDVSIPILFTETYKDMGFYSPFDGFISQKDVVTNFLISGSPENIYTIYLYNSAEQTKSFLKLANYVVSWGDGSANIFDSETEFLEHTYASTEQTYTISLIQKNPWGVTEIKKKVSIPHNTFTDNNNITFTPNQGSFSGVQLNAESIFMGDAINTIDAQTSDNFTTVPFTITGFTTSRLDELKLYGPVKFNPAVTVKKYGQDYGQVNAITDEYTAYTINNVQYYDYNNKTTLFFVESSGLTENMLEEVPITKEEILMGVVSSPEIQSGIFIERGKDTAFEALQRLGEVDNIGDLTSYGYGFFKINKT